MIGNTPTFKFLCSYGGTILPGHDDDKLRYQGGHTRVLSVYRSVSFAELMVKLGKLCGASVSVRCQLPSEELDALVSITSDDDLANLIEEYDIAAAGNSSLKIRAFLSQPKSVKKVSPPPPSVSSPSSSTSSPLSSQSSTRCPAPMANRYNHRSKSPAAKGQVSSSYHQVWCEKYSTGRNSPPYGYHQSYGSSAASGGGNFYPVHKGILWQ